MKLSIIVPVYNEEAYLERCLNSLRALPEGVEVIAIDDGSTDNSWEILQKHQDRVHIGGLAGHYGVSFARNFGIHRALGNYITFLDADDAMAQEGVANIIKAMELYPQAEVIQLNHRRCDNRGCKLDPRYSARRGFYEISRLPPKWAPVWNKAYSRDFIEQHQIRFTEGQQYDEDRRFNIECLRYTGGIQVDEREGICKYFDNDASLCHTMNREKMLGAIHGLTDMLREEQNPEIIELIRTSINMHLNSKKFQEALGGAK